METCVADAVMLLKQLIATPSVSRDESEAATLLQKQMEAWGMTCRREGNNVWTVAAGYDETRPTLLLNAHIDTVKPVATWTLDPFTPTIDGDRLYGLGSNDCGGGLMALLQAFRLLSSKPQQYNLIYLASAEEEVSGKNGLSSVIGMLPKIDVAIVGEPTGLQPATAEKGLMVIDGYADGVSGHAARQEGVNAIYEALDDLLWLRDYRFSRTSPLLGDTRMTVTVIEAGTQHNVVPDRLHFVLDVRPTDCYDNEELFRFLCSKMKKCRLEARSFRLRSSAIAESHPLVKRCIDMGLKPFGSPTLSDQALMPWPSLKLGPGESSRSHSADEYICITEIRQAIGLYLRLLDGLTISPTMPQD
ncbi:MAG: M20 family metallo-hydrolase [Prevotella sp.]|nr:M20 family metallo-hydrolase [Prevotella sp.]